MRRITLYLTYVLYYTKRQIKQISFCLLLLLLPLGTFLLANATSDSSSNVIQVALYLDTSMSNADTTANTLADTSMPDADTTANTLADSDTFPAPPEVSALLQKLLQHDGNIHFYAVDTKDALYHEVAVGHAECGYLLPATLYTSLDANKKNHLITVVTSPSTTLTNIINEVVYADLFTEYALHVLQQYLSTDSVIMAENDGDRNITLLSSVSSLYHTYLTNGATFHFEYQNTYQASALSPKKVLLSPIRGFVALFILLAAFCGCITYYNDKENHVYENRTKRAVFHLQILSILIPAMLISITGLFCLHFSGLQQELLEESLVLLIYLFFTVLFTYVLSLLLRNKLLFLSAIPFFLLGSLLFTPMIINLPAMLPFLKPVRFLFPPYYYLAYWIS